MSNETRERARAALLMIGFGGAAEAVDAMTEHILDVAGLRVPHTEAKTGTSRARILMQVNGGRLERPSEPLTRGDRIQLHPHSVHGWYAWRWQIVPPVPNTFNPGNEWTRSADGHAWYSNRQTPSPFTVGDMSIWFITLVVNNAVENDAVLNDRLTIRVRTLPSGEAP